jgi:hypothetical protein
MNLKLGTQIFAQVQIPLLWGKRAVIGHSNGALSLVYLGGVVATPEIVADKPAVGIEYSERDEGFVIFLDGKESYFYSPAKKLLRDLAGSLPECEISSAGIRVGNSHFQGNMIIGSQVGIGVTEQGFFMGGPIPEGLAPLLV